MAKSKRKLKQTEFGRQLAVAVDTFGVARADLAKALGVSDCYVYFLIRGELYEDGRPMQASAKLQQRFQTWLDKQPQELKDLAAITSAKPQAKTAKEPKRQPKAKAAKRTRKASKKVAK